MRLAVVGKGGAGKSVISATIARTLARRGHRVLALDSDSLPGMTFSLGASLPPDEPLLNAAVVLGEDNRLQFAEGIDPVLAAQRFATDAPDGVRLLSVGKPNRAGFGPVNGADQAFYTIVHHLEHAPEFAEWALIGDLPAGGRQAAYACAPYADHFLLVVEPTWQSMLTAGRISRIAAEARPGVRISLVVNKAISDADAHLASHVLGLPVLAVVPLDHDVRLAERAGVAVLDQAPDCAAVAAITQLVENLETDVSP